MSVISCKLVSDMLIRAILCSIKVHVFKAACKANAIFMFYFFSTQASHRPAEVIIIIIIIIPLA